MGGASRGYREKTVRTEAPAVCIEHSAMYGAEASSRARSGLGGITTSRLVPNLAAAARFRGIHVEYDSESDVSVASATPPPSKALFGSRPGSGPTQEGSAIARSGSLSTAMERVIRVERKRAGKASDV